MRKKIKRMLVPLILLLPLVQVLNSHGASFDCTKAATKVEKMICSDPELSKLDEEMAVTYKTTQQNGKQTDSILQKQKKWLKERNKCTDVACVKL